MLFSQRSGEIQDIFYLLALLLPNNDDASTRPSSNIKSKYREERDCLESVELLI